jgi:hypothetical protein
MSITPTPPAPGQPGYIRGGGGVEVDNRRLFRWAGIICVLALAGVVVALMISAAADNSRQTRLKKHGVPVGVTVTGCVGIGSGIGQATASYTCRGTYTLDGNDYTAVIRGVNQALLTGETIQGVTIRGEPGLLSTADAAARQHSTWTPFVTPIVLGAITLILAGGLALWSTRHRGGDARTRSQSSGEAAPEGSPSENPAGL